MGPIHLRRLALVALLAVAVAETARSQEGAETRSAGWAQIDDLTDASLEDLMNVEISSVSKRAERLNDAPAAAFVLTADDLRRAGVRSLGEAMRLVPGMDVAQIDASKWAISYRGFSSRFSNKLLVLIDGRAVYTPTFSGVHWDVQDVPMFDIERIEVIRGPGATLWGANAVNGVINVITKRTESTHGGMAHVSGGNEEMGSGTVRYGGSLGDDASFRIYGKGLMWDDSALPGSPNGSDAWERWQGGFRIDWNASARDRLTFSGDAYAGEFDQTSTLSSPTPPTFTQTVAETGTVHGANIGASWTRDLGGDESSTLSTYYDATRRDQFGLDDERDTIDVDFQHRFRLADSHEVTWGAGYRLLMDDYRGSYAVAFDPDSRSDQVFSAFVQDQIDLSKDRLKLTLGSKFEHNDYSGFEVQPSARIAWTIDERNTLWSAVSRAVRTPSRADHGVILTEPSLP